MSARDPSCIFCRIVAADADASIVTRADGVTAFMDLHPVVEGHTLVVPDYHTPGLDGVDDHTGGRMFALARRIAGVMKDSGLRCEGVNLFLAHGAVAGQTVFHAHLHVIPRYRGDGFGLKARVFGRGKPTRGSLDEQAERLARLLET